MAIRATARMRRILVIDYKMGLATILKHRLEREEHVVVAWDGISGFDMASHEVFDLLILDMTLPGQSGLDVCRKLRQVGSQIPILMLSPRCRTIDKVIGLRSGADDYLTKPFKLIELKARIDALLRRAKTSAQAGNLCDDLKASTGPPEVNCGGRRVLLSPLEFRLLRYFMKHRGTTLSRNELSREVWDHQGPLLTRTVDVHVAWLRQKIEKDPADPQRILTVFGFGYKFVR
jgi:two-component system, OmpR family, alkaline phosphatase synthesis response regulator PhoP